MSVACWKRFHNGFGTILDSQIASQRRSLRRSRGLQKSILFILASQEASGMDFGGHLDPLGLDFEPLLEIILAWKSSQKCVCHFSFALYVVVHHMRWILELVSLRDIFLAVLGILGQRVDFYFSFLFQFRCAMNHHTSHVNKHATLRVAHSSMTPMSMMGCAWKDVEALKSGHWARWPLCLLPLALF